MYSQGLAGDHENINKLYSIFIDTYDMRNNRDVVEVDKLNEILEAKYDTLQGKKRFLGAALDAYKTAFSGSMTTAVDGFIGVGVSYISGFVKSHKTDWRDAVLRECTFVKNLQMGKDASDFYSTISNVGALDLRGIAFKGFTCCNKIIDKNDTLDVFYISCRLDTSKAGVDKLLMHSKFQVVVDSIMFNPKICDIPNDSVSRIDERIGFDFKKRKNLIVTLNTKVKSSWVNEAIQVVVDQHLGEFSLEFNIDSTCLNENGVFVYSGKNPSVNGNRVRLSGDSFIVPRSYIGMIDDGGHTESCWGTGQYKLEMQLKEQCQINEKYYLKEGSKPNKQTMNSNWRKEWKIIKKRNRNKSKNPWQVYTERISSEYKNGKWVTTIASPLRTVMMQEGNEYITGSGH